MEFKVYQNNINEDADILPLTIQNYEDLSIKLIDERKKLSSEVWKYYGLLFNGNSIVNSHRYYCSLCLNDLHSSVNNGFKVSFSSVHNVSITTATGNLKMHLYKGHNINTFPDSVKDRYDVSLVSKESKRIYINVDENLIDTTDLQNGTSKNSTDIPNETSLNADLHNSTTEFHNGTSIHYITNNSLGTNEGSFIEHSHSLVLSYSKLKELIDKQMQQFNSMTILSDIWFNPIISTHYLKLSVSFVDCKWNAHSFTVCHIPLLPVTSKSLQTSYESFMNKFHVQKRESSHIYIICTKLVPQVPFVSDQVMCIVFLTNKLITKDGLYTCGEFRSLLVKCLNIISLLNSSYFLEEKLLEEYSEFLQQLAEVYYVIKFDEQNSLLTYSNSNQLLEAEVFDLKYVMRTSVILYLLKFITKNIMPTTKCLESMKSSHLFLEDREINCIFHIIKFLELFQELSEIFSNCNNTLIVAPALKNKIKEFCVNDTEESSVVSEIKASICSHLDEYYPMTYLVKMACILDPSVRDILEKEDAFQLLLNRMKTFNDSDEKMSESKKTGTEDKAVTNGLASKKLKLFESLKPHYQTAEYEDKFAKEVREYLQHVPTVEESEMPLLFWKNHSHKYPNLSPLAREYLSIPACCSPASSIVNLSSLKSQMELIHVNSFRLNSFSYFQNNHQFINH